MKFILYLYVACSGYQLHLIEFASKVLKHLIVFFSQILSVLFIFCFASQFTINRDVH